MDTRQTILAAIERVAPDVDAATLPGDVDFREEAELDSMDFLSVLTNIEQTTGVTVPEIDYAQIITIDQFAEYLAQRLQTA